ncbi:hypothetical protein, partial [Mixta sp. BE291]|uniref:hypothetical protein n=1 Tax=Mixta sp. BE291 TaxID=3158787 RepID=UPI003329D3C6
PSAISHQPSAISHQPSAISHQPSAISHQPSAIQHRIAYAASPSINFMPPAISIQRGAFIAVSKLEEVLEHYF